ncbi:MAG: Uma2 family endonuclease [Cyanobacteria bacterium P01_A01_bin.137]
MSQTAERVRWTVRDLEVLPQSEGSRYELINGELFVTRSPHRKHQQISGKIFAALDEWSEATGLGEAILAPGIIPSDTDNVIPDVVWISQQRLAVLEDEAGHLTGFPELIVEVLSPGDSNIRRDREAKLKLYSVQGVQEYWIADRFTRQLEVYRRQQGKLSLVATLITTDEVTSPLLPDFTCPISHFFGAEPNG